MKICSLYKKENNNVRCLACAHKCLISKGKTGICKVRKNINDNLCLLVYGKVAAMHIDPIEKKPLYKFLPRTKTFSIGTVGCNFKCSFCQNYEISQFSERKISIFGEKITPEEIVKKAIETGCKSVAYTYNEPAIFAEFVKDTAKIAKKEKLKNILVTNGYFSKESIDYIAKEIDAANIDLKSFSDKFYMEYCGARLKPVLETIKQMHKRKIHLEITTLVIPGLNDSEKEIGEIAEFIASIDKNIPWHISRFFPMYKMLDRPITPIQTLKKAEQIGKKYLNYVYVGNI